MRLIETARWWPDTFNALMEKSWIQDEITRDEATAIERVYWITRAYRDEPTRLRVSAIVAALLDMPFMDSVEPGDAVALEALHASDYHGKLNHILAQPVFQNGISDAEIPLAILASYIARTGGDDKKLERILVPGYVDIDTVSRPTALSPHMKVSIIRTGTERQPWIADAAFDAVELLEQVYGLPLPVGHVVMVISRESTCGCTWGFAFDIPLEWDQGRNTFDGHRLQGHIVHELAHSYYVTWEYWMHEGVARTFEYLYGVEKGLDPDSYKNWRGGCEDHDLRMFSEKAITPDSPEWRLGCAYYLGGNLFRELLDHLGAEEFGARLKELRLTYLHTPPAGRYVGIHEVRQVFATESDIVEKHWSGRLNAPESRR